jgi:hypothetical protein
MILQVNGGAMLELFWRQPGVRSWTYRTARDFLGRYVTHRDGLRGLRESLAQRSGSQRMLSASNQDVLHRGASLIASGDLVVAQSRFTKRRPGTGQELGSRWNSVLLLRREKLHPAPDLEAALAWLDRIKTLSKKIDQAKQDKSANTNQVSLDERELADYRRELEQARQLAASGPGVPDFSYLKQSDFIEQLERVLQSGLLIPIYHRPAGVIDSIPGTAPAAPTPQRSTSDREQAPEPSTFSSDYEPWAQGNALTDAAEDGVPFCEMCARAAEDAARKQ